MGNLRSSPLQICLREYDQDSLESHVIIKPEDVWLSIPVAELGEEMSRLKKKSLEEMETFQNRVERYVNALKIPIGHLRQMFESFIHELEIGLDCHRRHPLTWDPKECSLKMLDTCIKALPTGNEKGTFYALDFGITNFRVVRLQLQSDGKLETETTLKSLAADRSCPNGLSHGSTTAMQMFDFFGKTVKEFMKEQNDLDRDNLRSGFTFSFPCQQRKIHSATLIHWSKGFETGRYTDDPVEGLDVAELMNVSFKRNGVPIRCNAILNDTVGTLLSCAYSMDKKTHPSCLVGMILGTGMNCCYVDPAALKFGYEGIVINVECGNFSCNLPRTAVDCELDFKFVDRGLQQVEKMCSGAYLGEICRLTLVKIFQQQAPTFAWKISSLSTEKVFKIMNDNSEDLISTKEVITEVWNIHLNYSALQVVHRIATAVIDRSAALAAVFIAGCAHKTGRLQTVFGGLSVAIDGFLYKESIRYREFVRNYLDAILGESRSRLIHLLLADDGSGIGAGILSAITS